MQYKDRNKTQKSGIWLIAVSYLWLLLSAIIYLAKGYTQIDRQQLLTYNRFGMSVALFPIITFGIGFMLFRMGEENFENYENYEN